MLSMRANEVIGRFLREYRKKHGYTLEQISVASSRYGSGWTSGTVSVMERGGSKADSLPNMLILVQTLNDLAQQNEDTGLIVEPLTIGDLFRNAEYLPEYEEDQEESVATADAEAITENDYVQLTDTLSVLDEALAEGFDGVDIDLNDWLASISDERTIEDSKRFEQSEQDAKIIANEYGKDFDVLYAEALQAAPYPMSEVRAAAKLGIEHYAFFRVICLAIYGASLAEEVRRRAGSDANQQKRGRVTRRVVEEIQEKLNNID